jgi:hypothetical protein
MRILVACSNVSAPKKVGIVDGTVNGRPVRIPGERTAHAGDGFEVQSNHRANRLRSFVSSCGNPKIRLNVQYDGQSLLAAGGNSQGEFEECAMEREVWNSIVFGP